MQQVDVHQMSLLDHMIISAPVFQQLILDDCAIAICDLQQLRAYFPGRTIHQKVKVGDPLLPNSGVGRAISSGKKVVSKMSAELFGIPYVVVAVPVIEKGKGIVGGISLSTSIEREERLFSIARDLHQYVEGVTIVVADLNQKAAQLDKLEVEWREIVQRSLGTAKQSIDLSQRIKQISKESGILALNSGIEAARQGESGKVFNTIAIRMRSLATNVNHTVEEIVHNLESIGDSSLHLQKQLKSLENISSQIEQISKQLNEQIDEVKTVVKRLIDLEEV